MRLRSIMILAIISLFGFINSRVVLAEGETMPAQETSVSRSSLDTQWRWGEALSVDAQNKTLTIKYLDFESDQEKELSLVVDGSTVYENVKSLEEIQPKDMLSVDFVSSDSGNIAKNISIEKPESLSPVGPVEVSAVSPREIQSSLPVSDTTGAQLPAAQPEVLPAVEKSQSVADTAS